MVDYSLLHLDTFDENDIRDGTEAFLDDIAAISSEFLFQTVLSALEADYSTNMRASFMMKLEAPTRPSLSRCLFFAIIDGLAGYYTERSGMESFEMRYTLAGHGLLEYGGRKYDLGPGDGFLIDSSKPHRYSTIGDRWLCTVLQIDGPLPRQLAAEQPMVSDVTFSSTAYPTFEEDQFDMLRIAQNRGIAADYRLSAAIDTLLARLFRAKCASSSSRGGDTAEAVLAYLREHYREDVNFDDVAEKLFVSRAKLFSAFKAATGDTPYNYLLNLRIKRARLLLKATPMQVGDIARDVGFNDQGHFGQLFKRTTGMTPLQYRKS